MDEKKANNLALALAASQMGLFVVTGLLGGLYFDKKFGSTPLIGFIGLILGFVVGIQILLRLVRSNNKS